ncbi:unnamed protein product [Bathycoccus prasinos]
MNDSKKNNNINNASSSRRESMTSLFSEEDEDEREHESKSQLELKYHVAQNHFLRSNVIREQPSSSSKDILSGMYKIAVVGYGHVYDLDEDGESNKVKDNVNISMDKDKHGYRYDSVALTNGLIENGIYAVRVDYKPREHDTFKQYVIEEKFDAILVRINPGQITPHSNQERFDDLMEELENKTDILIFGNKASLRNMGSKIALVKIRKLACGLRDTRAYYTKKEMERGLKKGLKVWPRVLKQNRGSTGCGIWLVWLKGKHDRIMNMNNKIDSSDNNNDNNGTSSSNSSSGSRSGSREEEEEEERKKNDDGEEEFEIGDDTIVVCQEMNDNHIEEHTFKELVAFCACGKNHPDAGGNWTSVSDGNYLQQQNEDENEDEDKVDKQSQLLKGAFVVDQRLLPRISEGEIRMVFVKDELFEIIHKKPVGENGRSAVAWNNKTTFYKPEEPLFRDLTEKFLKNDIQRIARKLNLAYNALPLLWTADFIPMDDDEEEEEEHDEQFEKEEQNKKDANNRKTKTRYILGEFNCSCVGLTKFRAACGPDKDMSDVSDQDYFDGAKLCDLIGKRCKLRLDEHKEGLKRKAMVNRIAWGTIIGFVGFVALLSSKSSSSSGRVVGGNSGVDKNSNKNDRLRRKSNKSVNERSQEGRR